MRDYQKLQYERIGNISLYLERNIEYSFIYIIVNEDDEKIDTLKCFTSTYYRDNEKPNRPICKGFLVITLQRDFISDDYEYEENIIDLETFEKEIKDMGKYYYDENLPYYGKTHIEFYVSTRRYIEAMDSMTFGFIKEWMFENKNKKG